MSEGAYLLVQVSAGSEKQAWEIAHTVVEQNLVACAQVFPIRSCYSWEGRIEHDDELLILMKTTAAAYDRLEACIKEMHDYDVPEILAVPIVRGLTAYLHWMDEVVAG